MKNAKWSSLVLMVGLVVWFAFQNTDVDSPTEKIAAAAQPVKVSSLTHGHDHHAQPAAATEVARVPAAVPNVSSSSSNELRSLDEMLATVAGSAREELPLKGLVERLQKSGQDPRVIRDSNPYSGEMIVVRADTPLEGTRYFHAQYFVGEDGQPFVQHMSFEFKPSPTAMSDAMAAVAKTFPNLSPPTHVRDGYARWKLDDGHILWVKSLNADDVAHDPFNAYSPKDLGAVRVAYEQEIHD
jgi:hypothetical protein